MPSYAIEFVGLAGMTGLNVKRGIVLVRWGGDTNVAGKALSVPVNEVQHGATTLNLRPQAIGSESDVDEFHKAEFSILTPAPISIAITCNRGTEVDWSFTTARAAAQYDITDNGMVYMTYSEGFKAGGINASSCYPPWNPETVEAVEIGYKSSFAEGRTTLSFAAFDYDYPDFQVLQVIGLQAIITNAGDASIRGAELESSSTLSDNWSVSTAITLLDTEYGDFVNLDTLNRQLGF